MMTAEPKLKELGQWSLLSLSTRALDAYAMALFTRHFGMPAEEVKELCDAAEREVWNKKVHVYQLHYVVTARKPVASP